MTEVERIHYHLNALVTLMREDAHVARRMCKILNQEAVMPFQINLVKLPTDLVKRAEAQWDRLMEVPEFRAAAPRRSGAAAVRMLLQLMLDTMEEDRDDAQALEEARTEPEVRPYEDVRRELGL
jgi:hypothetical protein